MRKSIALAARELTLRDFFEERTAALDVRLDIAKRLLTAIGRMHERGRVHGRLDPDSVRLSGVRSFRVDVSVDLAPTSGTRDTRYSAPEGASSELGDVFALGVLLSELLPDAPPNVAIVLAVMRDPDPNARYATGQVAMCAFARAIF